MNASSSEFNDSSNLPENITAAAAAPTADDPTSEVTPGQHHEYNIFNS